MREPTQISKKMELFADELSELITKYNVTLPELVEYEIDFLVFTCMQSQCASGCFFQFCEYVMSSLARHHENCSEQ